MRTLRNAINCWIVRLWLVPRAEGSEVPVPLLVLKWFNEHLDTCKRCRSDLKELRLTTFALRRAGYGTRRKEADPHFADRVVNRVRQAEDLRRRRLSQVRSLAAALSAVATFLVMLVWLGIFNPLKAEWFPFKPKPPTPTTITVTAPPYGEHDPFDPGNIGLPRVSAVVYHPVKPSVQPIKFAVKPVPDYLTSLNLTKQPLQLTPVRIKETAMQSPPQLILAASPYQLQDRHTPPAILSSGNQSTGLTIVQPSPSDPGGPSIPSGVPASYILQTSQPPASGTTATATFASTTVTSPPVSTPKSVTDTTQPVDPMVTPAK